MLYLWKRWIPRNVILDVHTALITLVFLVSHGISHVTAHPHDFESRDPTQTARPPSARQPLEHLSVNLFGKPLLLSGEFDSALRYRNNFDLQNGVQDDLVRLDQQLKPGLFYRVTPSITLFLEGKLLYRYEVYADVSDRELVWMAERGRTWLHLGPLSKKPLALRLGRQMFRDAREWWWRADLDAIRLYTASSHVYVEVGLARQVTRVSIDEDDIDPRDNDVRRLLGSVTWQWAPKQQLAAFLLVQHDASSTPSEGEFVRDTRLDPSDATLGWLGLRTLGRTPLGRFGALRYWADSAVVAGEETLLRFGPNEAGQHQVISRQKQRVLGWAVDAGVRWQLPLRWHPTLMVGYAVGSGDRQPDRGTNHTFRQSGLQTNKARFSGPKRLRYYGELLRPELANLHIWTAALGARFWRNGGIDIAYHVYRQVEPFPFVSRARLRPLPRGQHREIGQEWDIMVSLIAGKMFRIALTGAVFRAGRAYGERSGALASNVVLQTRIKF